jgi:serine phosphatase RsbU (regulator of sigma subunit)
VYKKLLKHEAFFDNSLLEMRKRSDKIMTYMNWFLTFVCLALAPMYGTYVSFFLIAIPTLLLSIYLEKHHAGELITRLFMGSAFMVYTGLIIHQNFGDIEAHFSAFGLIGILLYYRDWRVIVIATIVIALHHLILGYVQTLGVAIYVFDAENFWELFLIHVGYFIPFIGMMSYLAIWLRRDGYESVLLNKNLENKVEMRTKELEHSTKNIKDSIEFASRIQEAILPEIEIRTSYFSDSFIFWQQKETVGGDIYFVTELNSKEEVIVMVIDGAGHGVYGAFITMLVKAIETQIMAEISSGNLDPSPGKILQYFNRSIKVMLRQEKKGLGQSNVGFDGGVLYYNKSTKVCKYAGAKTPLYIINDNGLEVIKSDRKNVGFVRTKIDQVYTEYNVQIDESTKLYILTDGMLDQEGEDESIYGKSRFETLVLKIHHQTFKHQQEIIEREFNHFRGKKKQRDDITVIGLKF